MSCNLKIVLIGYIIISAKEKKMAESQENRKMGNTFKTHDNLERHNQLKS